jgi:hypothetical protein
VELTFKGLSSGCRNFSWRTVREEPNIPSVLHQFFSVFCSIHCVDGFLLHGVRGQFVLKCHLIRDGAEVPGPIADGLLLRVQYW